MGTVKICIVLVCLAFAGRGWVHAGGVVRNSDLPSAGISKVLSIARAEIGIRELSGRNDGKRVREYLAYTGIKIPAAWCASYISWCFGQAGYPQPKTAWSPSMFPALRVVKEPKPSDVFGVYFSSLKRIAHVGLVESVKDNWIYSIEGNTSLDGNREGTGVFRRIRHKRTISKFADWIKL
jgi:hypothetical protein